MLFNSYTFVAFFLLVVATYYAVRSWTARKGLLLVASYIFYAAWNPPFVALLWFSTVVDWLAAKGICAASGKHKRRLLVLVSLTANLGLLGYFKYGTFVLDNFVLLMHSLGWDLSFAKPSIILPVGISFYTFQTLSYTLDVYRGNLAPARSFLDYALYVTFFPQLVAGPIVRAADFLPQCESPKRFSGKAFGWGLCLILLGLFEKVTIADGILAPIVETVYDVTDAPDLLSAWCATFAFAAQIFLDFAGYSLCAIGAAGCLGFALPANFRCPYAAVGFSDFWKRWHISLSSWLKDYLYIPLGGSRRGPSRTLVSLMMTMLLGGLWHGASWTFVVWGGLHGLYLILELGIRKIVPWRPRRGSVAELPIVLLTFLLVCVAWVFFRSYSFGKAFQMLTALSGFGPDDARRLVVPPPVVLSLSITVILLTIHWSMRGRSIAEVVTRVPWWVRSLAVAAMLFGIVGVSGEGRAFVYFRF